MKSFDDEFSKNFPDLVEAISCGDLIAKNYKAAIKEGFNLGAQSRQSEVDELQQKIAKALYLINMCEGHCSVDSIRKILEGENHES